MGIMESSLALCRGLHAMLAKIPIFLGGCLCSIQRSFLWRPCKNGTQKAMSWWARRTWPRKVTHGPSYGDQASLLRELYVLLMNEIDIGSARHGNLATLMLREEANPRHIRQPCRERQTIHIIILCLINYST
jgi:hypothetical protein